MAFQSTLLREERLYLRIFIITQKVISIHAPARGATRWMNPVPRMSIFQSTLLREERLNTIQNVQVILEFQSTLLREERPCGCLRSSRYSAHFNPRSCERSDLRRKGDCQAALLISIHAPARGATLVFGFPVHL